MLTVNPAAIMSFTLSPNSVTGGTNSTATLVLTGPAPPAPAGLTVTLMSSNPGAAAVPASGNFTIAGGASSGTFTVTTSPVSSNTTPSITATLPSGAAMLAMLTVNAPVVTSLSFTPINVVSGQMTTGTVTLSGPAPTGGLAVSLTSSNSAVFPVPASGMVLVPANANSQTFTVTAGAVGSSTPVTVTAKTGATMVMGSATVLPSMNVTALSFNPTPVIGGTNSTGTVTIGQTAPPGGIMVSLSSPDPAVTVPMTVTVPVGKNSVMFTATTAGVAMVDNVMVTASIAASNVSGTLTVNPAGISMFTFSPGLVTGGNMSTGTVVLSGPAPAAGLTVSLVSSNTSAAMVPASGNFNIAGGATSGTFKVSTSPVAASTPVTVTATLPSGTAAGAGLTVIPPVVTNPLSFNPSNVGSGQVTTGTVVLTGNAPTGGVRVGLSSNPTVTVLPSPVTVVAGTSSQTFMVTAGTVNSATPVIVTATTGTTSVMGSFTEMPVLTLSSTSASCTGMPETCTFSGTQITLTSAAIPVTLTNNSSSSVAIQSIAIGGTDSGDFGQMNNCPAMLAGLASCTINVTFTPMHGGNRVAMVTAMSSAPVSTATIDLMGTGFHWVSLTWSECMPSAMCPAVNNFNVYRITVPNGTATCPTTGFAAPALNPSPIPYSTTPMYSDIGVTANTTYCYSVTALNGAGESAFSGPTSPPVFIPSP